MVAINDNSMPGSDARRRRTQPLVNHLDRGMALDAVTGLYNGRTRDYSPSLSRWLTRDPIGYQGGVNLYDCVMSDPSGYTDPFGQGPLVLSRFEFLTLTHRLLAKIYWSTTEMHVLVPRSTVTQRGEILAYTKLSLKAYEQIGRDWVADVIKDTLKGALKVLFSDEEFGVILIKTVGKTAVKHFVEDLVNQLEQPKEMHAVPEYGSAGGKGNYVKAVLTYNPNTHKISAFVAGRVAANTVSFGPNNNSLFPVKIGDACPFKEFEFYATSTVRNSQKQGQVLTGLLVNP
jgi:RHS repeat-associated protein